MNQVSGGDETTPTIIIVMPAAHQFGGAELSLLHLLRVPQTRLRWHVVFLEDGPLVEVVCNLGLAAVVIETGRFRNTLRTVQAIRSMTRIVKSVKAVAVFGWMTKAHLYGGTAAWFAGVPAIWFQKGLPFASSIMEQIAARIPAAGIFTCSSFVAGAQLAITPKVPIRPIHSAVELDEFDPDHLPNPTTARQKLGIPSTGPLIGIFGRMQHWKGMHVVIDAMQAVLTRYPDAHLLIVGGIWPLEPGYFGQLHEQVKRLNLTNSVIFKGRVSATEIPMCMQACDVIVHASDREPFGIVILEAMALGKPVVAGSKGGPAEIITEGVDGLFAPFGDSEALALAILRYLDDEKLAHRIGQRARARAQQFSSKRFAENVIRELSSIVGLELSPNSPESKFCDEHASVHH